MQDAQSAVEATEGMGSVRSFRKYFESARFIPRRIDGIKLWSASVDGHICQGISPSEPSPSQELSKYCGKAVHLVLKGPTPRPCQSTTLFPELDSMATTGYADGYPLLILGEESVESVEEELRVHVGTQGIEERWKEDRLVIERYVCRPAYAMVINTMS
jgi:uncharacterized protein